MASLQRGHRFRALALATAALALAVLLWGAAASADARPHAPPNGKKYHGVSDSGNMDHFHRFRRAVRRHPAILQVFHAWSYKLTTNAFTRWRNTRTRGMVSISTAMSYGGAEVITPRGIARGHGDGYPLRLNRDIHRWGRPVYLRLMAEMNGYWNPYSAYNTDGSHRGRSHSQRNFRQAWRRFALIVRGGRKWRINRQLKRLGMPRIQRKGIYSDRRIPSVLPRAKAALMWVPQSSGSPDLPRNRPRAYWPGRRYVDWVGADHYARYPNWTGIRQLFRSYRKPFVLGEYGVWGAEAPAWIRKQLRWCKKRRRCKALVYYQGFGDPNPFQIWRYPRSKRALRAELRSRRFKHFAPEWR